MGVIADLIERRKKKKLYDVRQEAKGIRMQHKAQKLEDLDPDNPYYEQNRRNRLYGKTSAELDADHKILNKKYDEAGVTRKLEKLVGTKVPGVKGKLQRLIPGGKTGKKLKDRYKEGGKVKASSSSNNPYGWPVKDARNGGKK